jgi:hypothetical protein
LTWANLGPLYAGQTKSVTVIFKALDPGASPVVTPNTAAVSGAKFGNGRDTNTPPNATVNATINPTGSISGVVWSDGSGGTTGWVGTTGYESLGTTDFGIQGVTLTLFGCKSSTGDLFTTVDTTKSCTGQGAGAGWVSMGTTTTAAAGSYTFTGLRMGYYYVGVTAGLPGGAVQSAEPIYNGTGLTCGTANATCGGNWNPTGAATTVHNTNLSTTNFNPIGNNNPLTTPNEDIANVNFGYSSVPARIFGKVFTDSNGDGFQATGEADLSGITVRLCADSACTTVINTTTTGSGGQYSFTGFSTPGTYYVVVTPPGSTIQTADPDQSGTCSTCDNRTNAITIAAGQTKGSYDFGYQPNGAFSIGDTLYVDWNGSSAQDTGEEGIANVTVYLYEDENGNGVADAGVDALIATTTTGPSGNYLFGNRPNGSYLVVVDTSDVDFPATYTPTQDLDGGADSKAKVTLAGSSKLDVDFGYRPTGFGSIGDYVWHDQNGDGLQTAGEPGINGVLVRLYQDENGDGVIDAADAVVATQTTSGGGLYTFTSLAPGSYIVEIAQSNFTGGQPLTFYTMTTTGAAYTSSPTQVSYQKVLASGEAFVNADFGFAQGLIGDFIWRDDNGNGNPDAGEPGINAVTVTLYNDVNMNGVYDAGTDTFQAITTTDSFGVYQFGGLPGGEYVVVVTPPVNYTLTGDPDAYSNNPASFAYPPCNPADVVNYSFCDHQYGVTLYAGQVDRTADFGYKPLGVIGDTLWVDGNDIGSQDAGEAGIPFITVTLCSALPCTGGNIVSTTATNADGKYSFGGLGDNTYFVVVDTADPDFPAGLTQSYDPDGTPDNTAGSIVISGGVVTSISGTPCSNCDLNSDFGYRFTGTNNVSGRVWHDDDQGGQTGGIGDIDDPSGIFYANVAVYLWHCGTGTCSDGDEILAGITATDGGGQYSFPSLANGTYAVSINNNDTYVSGTDPTTPSVYNDPGVPWVVLSGGTNAVRDFGRFSNIDLGDLPAGYHNTILGDDGARHRLVAAGQVNLGAAIDADPNGQESTNASGDDNDLDGNDDDGVTRSGPNWTNGANGGAVTVLVNCPSAPCYLSAWVDWNRDNVFNGSGEQILLDFPVNSGPQLIQFDIPAGTFSGSGSNVIFYARFRLYQSSTNGLAQPTGLVVNGEVEDYQWSFTPTVISLRLLTVNASSGGFVGLLVLVIGGLVLATLYVIEDFIGVSKQVKEGQQFEGGGQDEQADAPEAEAVPLGGIGPGAAGHAPALPGGDGGKG